MVCSLHLTTTGLSIRSTLFWTAYKYLRNLVKNYAQKKWKDGGRRNGDKESEAVFGEPDYQQREREVEG